MDKEKIPHKVTGARFVRAVRNFAASEDGWKAKLLFGGLFGLLFAINGMNVLNSYVGRDFMTAIADRNKAEFIRQALFYIGVFAGSTLVSVIARFAEERLGLLWRHFITRRAVVQYLEDGTYYRLNASGDLENPDQRIAEDVRVFTTTTLSFVLMLLNSSFTVLAFSGVLWSISPLLFIVAVLYAAGGSFMTIVLGRPLVGLNYFQLDKEANFRSSLIHVRENAEALRVARREERLVERLMQRLEDLVGNLRRIIAINRNVGFFSTGYSWMIQIIPALFVAPAFIDGEVEFGVVTQSAMAFSMLVGAFSLIITQFQSISNFAAVVARLSYLVEAMERAQSQDGSPLRLECKGTELAYQDLSLNGVEEGSGTLLQGLTVTIAPGQRVLLAGPNQTARVLLFRATAGLVCAGSGRIVLPEAGVQFLAQRPYLPPGSLRQVLGAGGGAQVNDDQVSELLRRLELGPALARAGGLDKEQDWEALLSLREQQLLAFIHVLLAKPAFVFLDRIGAAVGGEQLETLLELLREHGIGYIDNPKGEAPTHLYDAVLEFKEGGGWECKAQGR
ncbi:ABC transporter ATP-binding protein/permease [Methyloterricola oryzae]|uniref:ABC transporter ATP-binding protein/permease n=1 Tax=Methyloterricola oryzae TaxID=1495050 RepID=UPI0005EB0269|nr:SbmA/BacA-like family transporter [Methyloterricola oryzae]